MMNGHDNYCNGQTLQSFLVYVNIIWQKISSKLEEISCGKYRRFNFNKKGLCCFFVNKMDFLEIIYPVITLFTFSSQGS